MIELDSPIFPSQEVIEKFKKLYRDYTFESKFNWIINGSRNVAIVYDVKSVLDVRRRLKFPVNSERPIFMAKAIFNSRLRRIRDKQYKVVSIGGNYYTLIHVSKVIDVLGSEVYLVVWEKETPLFIYNNKGICLIANAFYDDVCSVLLEEDLVDLNYICKLETIDVENNSCSGAIWDLTRLSDEEKMSIISKLVRDLNIRC